MRVMGLVTAKSYSSRVQRKNFKPLKGVPLYMWTTEFLNSCSSIFTSLVMSSDKPSDFDLPEIFIPLVRPKILCEDEMPHIKSVKHAVLAVNAKYELDTDWVILFQPTNPVRQIQELSSVMSLLLRHNESTKPTILRSYYNDENINPGYIRDASFAPDVENVIIRSGTMYAYNRAYLEDQTKERMDLWVKVPKWRGYNINNEEDFYITEGMMDCHNYTWGYSNV